MSTTFHVYPSKESIPTFAELLEVARGHLSRFLHDYNILTPARLTVAMRHKDDESNHDVPFSLTDPAWWPDDQYAWFFVEGIPGGTDAYAQIMDDLHRECFIAEIAGENAACLGDRTDRSLRIGRYWSFRRSAGQPAIINVAYGILAASLAELTDGIIYSGDSAWDQELFPGRPSEFLQSYFRPEVSTGEWKSWAQRCIELMAEELKVAMGGSNA